MKKILCVLNWILENKRIIIVLKRRFLSDKKKVSLLGAIIIVATFFLHRVSGILAQESLIVPKWPFVVYGIVDPNGNAIDPTSDTVLASIDDVNLIETEIKQLPGGSLGYSIVVPSDDPGTLERDGGDEGDTLTFQINSLQAVQTITWRSGNVAQLNLTLPAQPTPTPTATPTPTNTPTPTPTNIPTLVPIGGYHRECRTRGGFSYCVSVPGPGANQCQTTFDCRRGQLTPTPRPVGYPYYYFFCSSTLRRFLPWLCH